MLKKTNNIFLIVILAIIFFTIISALIIFNSCTHTESNKNIVYQAPIQELTDEKYPDNFQIESRSEMWNKYDHSLFQVERRDSNDFTTLFLLEYFVASDCANVDLPLPGLPEIKIPSARVSNLFVIFGDNL